MPSSTASCTQRTASPSTARPCANHQKNPPSVASLTPTTPSEPLKPSMGAAVRDHRNAVRDRSESLSAINRNTCPQSPESAKKGQIVFLDNVSTHKVDGVEEAIEARGARPIFLPAYSPDLNPIEQLFARLKSFLRKMKARTVEQLWRAIASFLKGVSKEECKAYLANSGYT